METQLGTTHSPCGVYLLVWKDKKLEQMEKVGGRTLGSREVTEGLGASVHEQRPEGGAEALHKSQRKGIWAEGTAEAGTERREQVADGGSSSGLVAGVRCRRRGMRAGMGERRPGRRWL